jgi:hypothetical protein
VLPFEPEQLTVETLGSADLYVSAVASTQWGIDYAFSAPPAVTLMDGVAFRDERVIGAQHLAAAGLAVNAEAAVSTLRGQFSVAAADPERIVGFVDCTGSRPIYYTVTDDWVAISNRQSLLSPICTPHNARGIDLDAAAWPIATLHAFGTRSIYAGVNLLPPGSAIVVHDGRFAITPLANTTWTRAIEKRPVTSADFDEATDDLVKSYRGYADLAARMSGKVFLSITGGKDSRLGLALAREAGLTNRAEFFTYGAPMSPECQVARHLCEIAGVRHQPNFSPPHAALSVDQAWQRLRFAAFRFDFCHGGVDGGYMPSTDPVADLELTGSYADIFRRIWKHTRHVRYDSVAEAARDWSQSWPIPFDALGLLRPFVRRQQAETLTNWIATRVAQGFDLNDTQEMFYVENRMTWWAGSINTAQLGRYRAVPLGSLRASRIGMALTVRQREEERLHFEVMRRLSGDLLRAPFLQDAWHESLRRENPKLGLAEKPFALAPVPPELSYPSWFAWFVQADRPAIRSYLLDHPHSGLFEIIDLDRMRTALARPDLTHPVEVRQILNAILMQMALTGDHATPRDRLLRASPRIQTNIALLTLHTPIEAVQRSPRKAEKTIRAALPKGIVGLRLDPCNERGLARVRNMVILTTQTATPVDLTSARPNKDCTVLRASVSEIVIDATGNDPQLRFNLSLEADATLEVTVFSEVGDHIDVFWDDGRGYSAERMTRIPI